MDIYIVIPAHNEEDCIGLTLQSLVNQTYLPKKVVVVNDNSTDGTEQVIAKFAKTHPWISYINISSSKDHIPGSKVINAFYKGYETLDDNYDIICKFDSDLIFPNNYLETITKTFKSDSKTGMAAGFCYIQKNEEWVLENLTQKDHIRGALKAYRKECFLQIGKLKQSMGWDTVDELLARFYSWEVVTIPELKVKHLRPTGQTYHKKSKYLQGQALYKLRYGFVLTAIASSKSAFKQKRLGIFTNSMLGFLKAKSNNIKYLVTKEQGKFIRKYRWDKILKKLF